MQTLGVPVVRPTILRTLDHDPQAFTQGLLYADGSLYESTGSWGASSLRRLSRRDGSVLECVPVADDFAEGIAFARGKIYQLMWTSRRVLIYETNPLRLAGEASFEHEGWGLAAHRDGLVATDGSHVMRRMDLALRTTRELEIRRLGLPLRHLNALDVVQDQAYVNVWYTTSLAQIDLTDGRLVRLVDCRELQERESPRSRHHIMNGVAFLPDAGSFLVTGKHWRLMFEIRLEPI